jgi:hypothetical protein
MDVVNFGREQATAPCLHSMGRSDTQPSKTPTTNEKAKYIAAEMENHAFVLAKLFSASFMAGKGVRVAKKGNVEAQSPPFRPPALLARDSIAFTFQ